MGGSYIWIVLQINPRHSKHLPIVRHCALHKDATARRTGTNFQTAVALINFGLNRSIPRQSRLPPQCCAGIRTPQSAARPNRRRAPCLRPNSRRSLRVKVSSSTKPCWHKNSTAYRIDSARPNSRRAPRLRLSSRRSLRIEVVFIHNAALI